MPFCLFIKDFHKLAIHILFIQLFVELILALLMAAQQKQKGETYGKKTDIPFGIIYWKLTI